jgi:uncharacterized protein (DUF2147 family)
MIMKRVAIAAAAVAVIASVVSQAGAAELNGLWKTQSSGGVVEIAPCGDAMCGRLVRSPFLALAPRLRDHRNPDLTLRDRPLKGLTILSGLKGGPTAWTDGRVYDPDHGATYAASIEMVAADELKVLACDEGSRCRTQTWRRLSR